MFHMKETLRSTNSDFNIEAHSKIHNLLYLLDKKAIFIRNETIYISSNLEDALSTKCIIFLFPLKFRCKQKNLKDTESKIGTASY